MVEVKREDITLQDRTKGISADEFAGGSYFYSEGIQSWYSTKWFKLWPYADIHNLNERTEGYPIAVCPCKGSLLNSSNNFLVFTKDWQIEMMDSLNGSTYWEGGSAWGGAIYNNPTNYEFKGGFVYGDYAIWFGSTFLKRIPYKDTYSINGQTITNPRFENSAAWWTIGTGWTLTDDWMQHTTWETWTLSVDALAYDSHRPRLAVKVTHCTAWSVTVDIGWYDCVTSEAGRNWWFVWSENSMDVNSWSSYTITVTPTADFNGIVEAVNFNVYKYAYDGAAYETSWLTAADKHMAVARGGDIYITSWATINVLSTLDRKISATKNIINWGETIVAITQQADSLIIWATDGIDSHQYYRNWVDNVATEVIEWKWQVIKAVTGTEIVSYVLAGVGTSSAGFAYRLYSVNGYQRSLIASNAYKVQGSQWNLDHYHPSKKFAFNDVQWPESMCIYMDNLYLPGCDGIYQFGQTIPGLSNAWSRPIDYENGSDRLFLFQNGANLSFTYRLSQKNYYVIIDNARYCYKWYIVTDSIYRDKLGTRKALEKLKIGYKSLSNADGNIKIYAIVDDDYFWRFDVTGVTNRPAVWDIYEIAEDTEAEIIRIEKTSATAGTITLRTTENGGSLSVANRYLTKVSGNGDNSIDSHNNYDNMVRVKTITTSQQWYGSDLIFGKDFVNNYLPYWHKIQLVIELNKNSTYRNDYRTPEVYELSMVSDITDVTL